MLLLAPLVVHDTERCLSPEPVYEHKDLQLYRILRTKKDNSPTLGSEIPNVLEKMFYVTASRRIWVLFNSVTEAAAALLYLQQAFPESGFDYVRPEDTISIHEEYIGKQDIIRKILGPTRWVKVPTIESNQCVMNCERVIMGIIERSSYRDVDYILKHLEQIKTSIQIVKQQRFRHLRRRFVILFESAYKAMEALCILQRVYPMMGWQPAQSNKPSDLATVQGILKKHSIVSN